MTKKRRLTTEEVLQPTRAALERFDLEHAEIAFRADDEAFLGPDVAALFADEAKAAWTIGYALQIVVAELRVGEAPPDQEILDLEDDELWQLYERRALTRLRPTLEGIGRAHGLAREPGRAHRRLLQGAVDQFDLVRRRLSFGRYDSRWRLPARADEDLLRLY